MKTVVVAACLIMSATTLHAASTHEVGERASVLVDVSRVVDELVRELSIELSRIPPGVDMQIDAAAKVCAASPDMLAYAEAGGQQIGCEATTVSDELIRALREQIDLRQNSSGSAEGLD